MGSTFAILAGGGTAGHILPGLAIAQELRCRGVAADSLPFVGSERGIEQKLVPAAGFPLTVLPGRGIQRRFTVANIAAVFGLLRATVAGVRLVRRLQPAVVIGLGGYASVPCVLGAILWRIPIVVAEQNAVPGAANRLAGRFAKACAVSFPDTDLPRTVWTGNPVRGEVIDAAKLSRLDARAALGVDPDRVLLTVFGGSLGARRINQALFEALPAWRSRRDLAVRHVCGSRDHRELATRIPINDSDALDFSLIEYETDMPTVYAASDLILCRAGASSVAELAVVSLPSILVPLPGAPGDHQTANAKALADSGAAVLVADHSLTPKRLLQVVDELIDHPEQRAAMRKAAALVARQGAAAAVVDVVLAHARRRLPPPGSPVKASRET